MTQDLEKETRERAQKYRCQVADSIGGLMELWGFKRIMGRMWALLYLADQPLSAAELGEALQVSPGSISMTVSELLKWGVVKKTWVPGDRRDYYLPETSLWKMVSRVFRERELLAITDTIDQLASAQSGITELQAPSPSGESVPLEAQQQLQRLSARVQTLQRLSDVGQLLLQEVLSGQRIDLAALQTTLLQHEPSSEPSPKS